MYLTLEDLIPNALIALSENNMNCTVSYITLIDYGRMAIKELEKRNVDAIMLVYKELAMQFEHNYKEYFDFFEIDGVGYVRLKDNVPIELLRKCFRTRETLDVLIAFESDNCKRILGIIPEKGVCKKKKLTLC